VAAGQRTEPRTGYSNGTCTRGLMTRLRQQADYRASWCWTCGDLGADPWRGGTQDGTSAPVSASPPPSVL